MQTTVGQILINESLPEDLRDYSRVLDKKGVRNLLREVAQKYPDRYSEIVHQLSTTGADIATATGFSFSLDDLKPSKTKQRIAKEIKEEIRKVISNRKLPRKERNEQIINILAGRMDEMRKGTYEEGLQEGNRLSRMVQSGAKGNQANLSSLRGADLLLLDHRDRPIPIPILNNYSEGLSPVEYFAGAYGTRKGIVATKMGVAQGGFLNKQLVNAASKLLVTDEDPLPETGYPVDTDDEDNDGAVLARNYGPFAAGTIITPTIRKALSKIQDEILVHSPISSGGRGVPRLAAGVRERGDISPIGDNIGIASAQSVSEPISQASLSAKHGAGVVGASRESSVSGFQAINQMVQVPKSFRNAATLASRDGRISRVESAPQGGSFVYINDEKHYVPAEADVVVKPGDEVEAGDVLSDGIPNPADVVQHKHIGEGRRYFQQQFRKTLENQGIRVNRRNLEVLARGLIDHVRVVESDGVDGALPDDILSYDEIATRYTPRFGNALLTPNRAVGKYLERPVMHYSIGTRITPKVVGMMQRHRVGQITVHDDPPPFEPHMMRAMQTTVNDRDFARRLSGFYITEGFLDAARRSGSSPVHGQHWAHPLAEARDFGKDLTTKGIY